MADLEDHHEIDSISHTESDSMSNSSSDSLKLSLKSSMRDLRAGSRGAESSSASPTLSSNFRVPSAHGDYIVVDKDDDDAGDPAGDSVLRRVSSSLTDLPRKSKARKAIRKKVKENGEKFKPDLMKDQENPKPPFERYVDLMIVQDTTDRKLTFITLDEKELPSDAGLLLKIFTLDDRVRRLIYGHCLPYETRHVTLSPHFATKAAFGPDYFADPFDILEDIMGALESSPLLRNDLMAYFWSEHHFHVTISKFSGPKFSPLSHVWLHAHLSEVRSLTIEVDYTRFGFSCRKGAPACGQNMDKEEGLVDAIFKGLAQRTRNSTVKELNLLCRRYAGFHPHRDEDFVKLFGAQPVPYCPDSAIDLPRSLCGLARKFSMLRMAGFSQGYTDLMLRAMNGLGFEDPVYYTPPYPAWPPMPAPSVGPSFVSVFNTSSPTFPSTFGKSSSAAPASSVLPSPTLPSPPLPSPPLSSPGLQLKLKRSTSLTEKFETELHRQSSIGSSNYTVVHDHAVAEETEEIDKYGIATDVNNHAEIYQDLLSTFTPSEPSTGDVRLPHLLPQLSPNPSPNLSPNVFPRLSPHSPQLTRSLSGQSSLRRSREISPLASPQLSPRLSPYTPVIPRYQSMGDLTSTTVSPNFKVEQSTVRVDRLTPEPVQPARAPTPRSPNTMNLINEQDPAFV
ncbi:hypothetical protein BJ875DRAFT_71136 [Amylocarpus encephaloides]|uniref:Uncharacterized protein n=1 Tax=Amylocarpus encephaloides TaxID=45428 RepID=A0A9P7YR11_9HELO|nr:hypothetical protein BJ875DRAFT_71136 [Amylocarpus encephaloides]